MIENITYSCVHKSKINREAEVNGRWVAEVENEPYLHFPGILISEPAPLGTDDSLCFTAPNKKRYMDTPDQTIWLEGAYYVFYGKRDE